jgi:hypothetical protein
MKQKIQKILTKFHFIALTIVIINLVVKYLLHYSLEEHLDLGVKLTVAITGLTLFFLYFNPFKKVNFYFSIYAIAAILILTAFIFRGLFWFVIISLILFPLILDEKKYAQNGIIISDHFEGFLANCCTYVVKERKYLIFEKNYGIFETEGPINFETINIESTQNEIVLTYSLEFDTGKLDSKITQMWNK